MKPIFLSYSRQDSERARELYRRLRHAGFQVWFDEENLLPGQIWEVEIKKVVQNSALVLVLLSSRSVSRQGYAQKEIRAALDFMEQIPEGRPYLIPLKLDDCETPGHLAHIHFGTLYDEADFQRLLKVLNQYVGPLEPTPGAVPVNYARYVDEFENDEFLILPGYGAAQIRVRQPESTIERRLGPPSEVKNYLRMEIEGKAHPESRYYNYYRRGVSVLAQENVVKSIFLYGSGDERFSAFAGATPEGVSATWRRSAIEAVFGRPTATGGGAIDYWVSYHSIGLSITYRTKDPNDFTARVRELVVVAPR